MLTNDVHYTKAGHSPSPSSSPCPSLVHSYKKRNVRFTTRTLLCNSTLTVKLSRSSCMIKVLSLNLSLSRSSIFEIASSKACKRWHKEDEKCTLWYYTYLISNKYTPILPAGVLDRHHWKSRNGRRRN